MLTNAVRNPDVKHRWRSGKRWVVVCYLAQVLEAEEEGAVQGLLWKKEPVNPGNHLRIKQEGERRQQMYDLFCRCMEIGANCNSSREIPMDPVPSTE